jgi:hypothetical protein
MEPKVSLPDSQEPTTSSEQMNAVQNLLSTFLRLILILSSHLCLGLYKIHRGFIYGTYQHFPYTLFINTFKTIMNYF